MRHVVPLRLRVNCLYQPAIARVRSHVRPPWTSCRSVTGPQFRRWNSHNAPLSDERQNAPPTAASSLPARNWSTPLAKTLADAIQVTGPVSLSAYMRQCLTSELGGYYTSQHSTADQFGKKGDFITSPEISQVFGELVGVWFLSEWMGQGTPQNGVQFIELGPGRGTLMSDILRTAGQFKTFRDSLDEVWMVEAGPALRQQQCELLCDTRMAERSEELNGKMWTWWEATSKPEYGAVKVKWVEDIVLLPPSQSQQPRTPFIVAHEFFDALPIQAFESIMPKPQDPAAPTETTRTRHLPPKPPAPEWRELLINTASAKPTLNDYLRTPAELESSKPPQDDFHLTLSPRPTPPSLLLSTQQRYRPLLAQAGNRVETSPDTPRYAAAIARLIGNNRRGAALVIDYGPADTIPVNSLRGIRRHEIVSPFNFAGQADLSADVDFEGLAGSLLEASEGVEVHGPVEQGMWLGTLGVRERAEKVVRAMREGGEGKKEAIAAFEAGWRRLVEGGPKGMGKAYKVLAVLPEAGGKRRPVGFGGDVVR